jgi:ribosome-associated protein
MTIELVRVRREQGKTNHRVGLPEERNFGNEFIFAASRSSGPGGQNVNKVSTKVELRISIPGSALLTVEEKELIRSHLKNKINDEGFLILVSQSERTQLKNKEKCIEKFYTLLRKTLAPKKKRRISRPTAAAKEKRLEEKRIVSEKKSRRKEVR